MFSNLKFVVFGGMCENISLSIIGIMNVGAMKKLFSANYRVDNAVSKKYCSDTIYFKNFDVFTETL
jgi:hypothetical protein